MAYSVVYDALLQLPTITDYAICLLTPWTNNKEYLAELSWQSPEDDDEC